MALWGLNGLITTFVLTMKRNKQFFKNLVHNRELSIHFTYNLLYASK